MWATVSIVIAWILVSWMSWQNALFVAACYTLYSPKVWHGIREMNTMFSWLRLKHCRLQYAGRIDLLKESRARIFVFHPHGMHCVGAVLLSSDPAMTHVRVACTSILFWLPIIKEFCTWGNAFPCDRRSLERVLTAGTPVVLYPGGLNEIPNADFLRTPDAKGLHLARTGFIRVAMQQEIEIVPCWVDGETELYTVYHPWPALQHFCYRLFRYPWPTISIGWKWMPFLPKSRPITIHIGEPISMKKTGQLEDYHQQYRAAIHELSLLYPSSTVE